jgi:predicted ATPase with chaperone activity
VQAIGVVRDRLEGLSEMHDDNREAASQYQDLVSEQSAAQREQIARVRDAEQARWDALGRAADEAGSRPPVPIRTELQQPDTEAVRRGTQGTFDRRPVKIRATIVDRNGKEVI